MEDLTHFLPGSDDGLIGMVFQGVVSRGVDAPVLYALAVGGYATNSVCYSISNIKALTISIGVSRRR